MHNLLSDMDLQTRPLKSRFHFLAMTGFVMQFRSGSLATPSSPPRSSPPTPLGGELFERNSHRACKLGRWKKLAAK